FVVAGLLAFLESFEAPQGVWRAASLAFMVLAFLSKESAYAFPLIAVLLALARRIPLRRAMPMLAAFFVAALSIFAYRLRVLGGIGGCADPSSGTPLFLKLGFGQVLRSLLLRTWAVLYFPIDWSVQPELWLGVATLAYVAALIWIAASRRPRQSLL